MVLFLDVLAAMDSISTIPSIDVQAPVALKMGGFVRTWEDVEYTVVQVARICQPLLTFSGKQVTMSWPRGDTSESTTMIDPLLPL